ncbi:MAG: hypothetical protein IKA33_00355, partial [Candidatus Methanomethylophilaceae archaeon]|nr:hypothetical protein [Candidatus Methanomethylophilaceae archaeon]
MHGKQKTLDSFLDGGMTESEVHQEAHSMCGVEDVDLVPYDDLIDKVLDDDNIRQALERVVGNRGSAGIDDMTVTELEEWLPANIGDLKEKVRAGKYKPMPVRRVEIPKPDGGTRKLGVPAAVDRLLQQAVAQVLTPIYEPLFSESSFGFRPNRSAHDDSPRQGTHGRGLCLRGRFGPVQVFRHAEPGHPHERGPRDRQGQDPPETLGQGTGEMLGPPCTERYARWLEGSASELITGLLLDQS